MVTVNETNREPDGTFEALEAIDSITDPEGNTVTSLSDPVRVAEEASTFAESDITITENQTVINNGSIQLGSSTIAFWFDDFEDGVDSGWTGDTGFLTAQTNTVLSGTQTGKIATSDNNGSVSFSLGSAQTTKLGFRIRIDGGSSLGIGDRFDIKNGSSASMGVLRFNDNTNDIEFFNGSVNTLRSWSFGTVYDVEIEVDATNDEFTFIIDGTNEGTFTFQNSSSGYQTVEFLFDGRDSSPEKIIYFDNFTNPFNSGDALVSFDSGSPGDIDSWDLATFQRTLDGETVTIDVEDSNGNVLKSDISKDTDISDIATSTDVQLRANLSRNDTSNNPTVDYLARRFTR